MKASAEAIWRTERRAALSTTRKRTVFAAFPQARTAFVGLGLGMIAALGACTGSVGGAGSDVGSGGAPSGSGQSTGSPGASGSSGVSAAQCTPGVISVGDAPKQRLTQEKKKRKKTEK